jgi:2-keto-3-deoxy-galactonokinase
LFHIRINDLFKTATAEENYSLLMGILIGEEIKDLHASDIDQLVLVCSEDLNAPYLQAIKVLYPTLTTITEDAGEALIKGQWKVLKSLKFG